jgi:hypothetical protein
MINENSLDMKNDKKSRDRLRFSPIEKEILWALREAGEDNLAALLNTVEPIISSPPVENFLPYCEQALANLLRLKYIELRNEQDSRGEHYQLPFSGEFNLYLAIQRDSDGLWQQTESWNSVGRIVVVQLVDHWAG